MNKVSAPKGTNERMDELLRKKDLTVAEAAEMLDLSAPTVYRMVDAGDLDYWRKTANSGIRIYTVSVLDYIKKVQGRSIGNGHSKK